MKMTFMGTGTSHGIPVIGCSCPVCTSSDPRDNRLRCSVYVENCGNSEISGNGQSFETTNIVIDTGPEFRIQCLKHKIKRLDGVLLTHSHADHIYGLDDLRIFSYRKLEPAAMLACRQKNPAMSEHDAFCMNSMDYAVKETEGAGLPIYANSGTLERIIFTFPYVFNKMAAGGGIPKLNLLAADNHTDEDPIKIGSFEIVPVPMLHGSMIDYGWILRNKNADGEYVSIVYLTDCSQISDRSIELVKAAGGKIEHLVIDALRESPHPTHCNFEQSLGYAERIGAVHTWLTHICHDRTHVEIQKYISENLGKYPGLSEIVRKGGSVEPAYDGLEIEA